MMESSLEAKGPGRSRSGCVFFLEVQVILMLVLLF